VYIVKIEPRSSIRMYSYIGKHIPLYCTAVGKTFLSYSLKLYFTEWWLKEKETILPLTEHTITDQFTLRQVLDSVHKNGYAVDDEENELGIFCVAAPIFDYTWDVPYAISVSSPKFRTEHRNADEFLKQIQETATAITLQIGGLIPSKS